MEILETATEPNSVRGKRCTRCDGFGIKTNSKGETSSCICMREFESRAPMPYDLFLDELRAT